MEDFLIEIIVKNNRTKIIWQKNGNSLLHYFKISLVFTGNCPQTMKFDEKFKLRETAQLSRSVDDKHSNKISNLNDK